MQSAVDIGVALLDGGHGAVAQVSLAVVVVAVVVVAVIVVVIVAAVVVEAVASLAAKVALVGVAVGRAKVS